MEKLRFLFCCFFVAGMYFEVGITECMFPSYLQSPIEDGLLKPWKTMTWWLSLRDNPRQREQGQIFVSGSSMWENRDEYQRSCEKKSRRVTERVANDSKCIIKSLKYNRTCLMQDDNKYRVVEFHPRRTVYLCLSFVKRSDSVIQIRKGPTNDINVPDLCNEQRMNLDEWPWIATWKPNTFVCPVSGGFSFRTTSRLTKQDLCKDEWRHSRLEMECLNGDGMTFTAPKGSNCNPFSNKNETSRLHCWAGWSLGSFTYMVASIGRNPPQFCVRFPREPQQEFVALVYFSVICPTSKEGNPPSGINYYEMQMKRNDPTLCADDNPKKCERLKENGMCDESSSKYFDYCKKTCSKCGSPKDKYTIHCPFDYELHGSWKLYDLNREETIMVNRTTVNFSEFGSFTCLKRTPDESQYKALSTFDNGCAPRYSCIELKRRNRNVMQYRIGQTFDKEVSYEEMCIFHDDPYPLMDTFRSSAQKNLIINDRLWSSFCGFDKTVSFNGTFHGEQCIGTLSDRNSDICKTEGILQLRAQNCRILFSPRKYQCLVYLGKDELLSEFLITKRIDGRTEFNCWVISTIPDAVFQWPQKVIYKMPTPQCSMFTRVLVHHDRKAQSEMFFMADQKEEKCIQIPEPALTVEVNTTSIENRTEIFIHEAPNRNTGKGTFGETDSVFDNALQPANQCANFACVRFYFVIIISFCGHLVNASFTDAFR